MSDTIGDTGQFRAAALRRQVGPKLLQRPLHSCLCIVWMKSMKEKQVSEVLPLMTRERAIALTQALAER